MSLRNFFPARSGFAGWIIRQHLSVGRRTAPARWLSHQHEWAKSNPCLGQARQEAAGLHSAGGGAGAAAACRFASRGVRPIDAAMPRFAKIHNSFEPPLHSVDTLLERAQFGPL